MDVKILRAKRESTSLFEGNIQRGYDIAAKAAAFRLFKNLAMLVSFTMVASLEIKTLGFPLIH